MTLSPGTPVTETTLPTQRAESGEVELLHKVELLNLADKIRTWQETRTPRISDNAIVKQFPGLGSTKTYARIRNDDLHGLVIEVHLAKYRGVWAQIEALAGAGESEEIYEDLTPALTTGMAVASLIPQEGKNRLLIIEGPSGSGKTESLKLAGARYAGSVVFVEAHEGWSSVACALRDMILAVKPALKREELPQAKAELLAILIDLLNEKKLMLCIDEGQHACAGVLNIIKTLLNRSRALVVVAAIGTLWRKLTLRSWEETCQLIHNRLHDRVVLRPPGNADIEVFLQRRVRQLESTDEWKKTIPRIRDMAAVSGHFAFLRDLASIVNGGRDAISGTELLTAATELKRTHEAR